LAMLETDFAAEAKDKGLVLGIDKADYWVRSEALLLDRILRNLLTNAIRYTESGRVSLRLERVDESAVRITVSDTGRGIPADKQEKIFQEFYRNGAKMEKGLGLGLAIAQQMAKLLESQVLIHSVVGKGSDFSIKVPEGIPDAKDIDVTLKQTSPAYATLLTDQLVIVLDDDPQILKATAGLLERWGCLVISAGNKGAILADLKVQNRQPLAYIVDYQLDDSETGIDVLCNLLEGDLTSRGIIISGNTDPTIEQRAKEAGFSFFSKPLRPAKLATYLRHLARKI
jgi:CheY-like chemotaxis protein